MNLGTKAPGTKAPQHEGTRTQRLHLDPDAAAIALLARRLLVRT